MKSQPEPSSFVPQSNRAASDDVRQAKKALQDQKSLLKLANNLSTWSADEDFFSLVRDALYPSFYFTGISVILKPVTGKALGSKLSFNKNAESIAAQKETKAFEQFIAAELSDKINSANTPLIFHTEGAEINYPQAGQALGIKQIVGMSLQCRQQQTGILVFYTDKARSFTQKQFPWLLQVAGQVSLFVNNHIPERASKIVPGSNPDKVNEIILSLSAEIARVRDKEELIHVMRYKLKKVLHFNDITVGVFNKNKTSFQVMIAEVERGRSSHPEFDHIAFREYPVDDGIHDVLLKKEGPQRMFIETLMSNPDKHQGIQFIADTGIKEIAGIKLVYKNEVIGFITLLSQEKDAFTETDLELLNRIAGLLSVAVANIIANADIENREREKSALLFFSNDLSAVRDKKDLSAIMYNRLKGLVYFDDFFISSFHEDAPVHRLFLQGQEAGPVPASGQHPVISEYVKHFLDKVLASGEPLRSDIVLPDKDAAAPEFSGYGFADGMRHITGIPLSEGKKSIGVFCLLLKDRNDFKEDALNLLQALSCQLSIAIANIMANTLIERQLAEISRYKEQLEEEKLYLQEEAGSGFTYSDIIGSGEAIKKVFNLLSQVSFAQSSVLILGETGTGKELVARAIHNASPRKDKLMVKVNCATLPANLIESELFGHEKGSFTGAIERRIGKFELANHGTLFLDEIGEMPLELQVKLLRAIQEKEIERVGGNAVIRTDVRIIAATNRNLQKEVTEGRFRSDLFYRLNVFPITLPPLRDRKEDIPALATYFAERSARNTGKKDIRISNSAMKELMAYHWPGNVRELEHLVERSLLLTTGNIIRSIHLPLTRLADNNKEPDNRYTRTLEEMEREYILAVLKKCNGKISGTGGAAEILGLHVSTLNSRMKKLGILKEQHFTIKKN